MATPLLGIAQAVKNLVMILGKSFHIFIIFALPGYIYMYSRFREAFWPLVVFNLSHVYLILKATESATLEAFLLPTFFTYSLAIALGLIVSLEKICSRIVVKRITITTLTMLFCTLSLVIRLVLCQYNNIG